MDEAAYSHQPQTLEKRREGQIPREMERQYHAVEGLHSALSVLEEATASIRTPQAQPSGDPRPEAIRAGLAQVIAERTDAIENATRRIRLLIDEIEL